MGMWELSMNALLHVTLSLAQRITQLSDWLGWIVHVTQAH